MEALTLAAQELHRARVQMMAEEHQEQRVDKFPAVQEALYKYHQALEHARPLMRGDQLQKWKIQMESQCPGTTFSIMQDPPGA